MVTDKSGSNSALANLRGFPLLLIVVTVALGLIYMAIIPPWGGPDEPRHFEYVRLLQDKGRLVSWSDVTPAIEREIIASMDRVNYWQWGVSLWKRSGAEELPANFRAIYGEGAHQLHQPPLAYLVYLAVFKLAPRAPLETQLNLMRLVSIALNVAVVLAAYAAGRELFAAEPEERDLTIAMAIPIFIMLLPQHLFLHSTINNDHLAEAAMAWIMALIARTFRLGLSLPRVLLMVALLGIGLASKRSALVGIGILGWAFLVYAFVHWGGGELTARQKAARVAGAILVLSMVVLFGIGGWLFISANAPGVRDYIVRLFLFLPSEQFPFQLDARIISSEALATYADYVKRLFYSTWGHYGWMNITLGVRAYWFFAAVSIVALVGIGLFAIRDMPKLAPPKRGTLVAFAGSIVLMLVLVIASQVRLWDLGWGGDPQGRYLFPVLIPMATLFLLGLRAFVPARLYGVWFGVLVAAMALFNLVVLVWFIVPFYRA